MSKFPSIHNVLNATKKTVFRFPLEVVTAIIGTIFSILLIDTKYGDPNKELYTKAIMSSCLCLSLLLSVSLFFITSKKNKYYRFLISLLLATLTTAFIFNFHKEPTNLEIQQFASLFISFHLLVSFAGFLPKKHNQEEFWEFNKQLFLRILTSGLYSIILYSGLALAILALKELFKIEFDEKIYGYLFFVIAGIFNTIFFLNGVPEIKNEKTLQLNYPIGLKNFTQYVLLPLISIYLVILISYEAKILITFSLPIGWVSYLVLVFAIFGILSFLLIFPISSQNGNLWMRSFSRWFYFLLIPLLGLLFWAILYRINLYGFTYERYYVLLLAIWLTIVVGYFLIQKDPKIKFIPISLCIAGLLSIAGPQSANNVSKNSQLARFETYMQKLDSQKITFEQEQDLSSIVSFLTQNYGVEIMVPYAKTKLDVLLKKNTHPSNYEIMESLGLEFRNEYDRKDTTKSTFYYSFYENNDNIKNIHGQDFMFTITSRNDFACNNCISLEKKSYSITSKKTDYGLDLQINQDTIPLKINDFVNTNSNFRTNNNSNKQIIQKIENPKYALELTYITASGSIEKKRMILQHYEIEIMIDIKK